MDRMLHRRAAVFLHNARMLPSYLLLDLESTGGNPVTDHITEIAAVRIDEGREVARWSTLVNPERSIPEFIQRMTGISNDMVSDAPSFDAVAGELKSRLKLTRRFGQRNGR